MKTTATAPPHPHPMELNKKHACEISFNNIYIYKFIKNTQVTAVLYYVQS